MGIRRFLTVSLAALGLAAAAASPSSAQEGAVGLPLDPGLPYTRVFDMGAASIPDGPRVAPETTAWTLVPEGDLTHTFVGDAVLLNDKTAVLLRRNGPGADVYAIRSDGWALRASLIPACTATGRAATLSAVRVSENDLSAVMLGADFRTDAGATASAAFRLTAGEALLEARAGPGTGKFTIAGEVRYVVVPDFFGDDMVFDARAFDAPRLGLPTENFFLSLIEGGDAIVMCVWPSGEQQAELVVAGGGSERTIRGCEIECAEGEKLWVAFLECPNIWHSRAISAGEEATDITLDWEAPFPAKWRADFIRRNALADSWDFRDEREPGYVSFAPGQTVYPCWFDSNRACVRAPRFEPAADAERVGQRYRGLLILYPIDRSRATPLTVFCPIDIIRNTLGVGPCQYILAMEGLGAEGHATPDDVTRWVEKTFKRKRDKRDAAAIEERLSQMVDHIEHTRERIEQYDDFAAQVRRLCLDQRGNPATGDTARRLGGIADDMTRSIALRREAMKTPDAVRRLTDAIVARIGTENALAECQRLGAELRSIGAAQDNALAKCRMAVRWLKQQCRTAAAGDPQGADLAEKIQAQAEQMLRRK